MGIVRKPAISDYWGTSPLLKGLIFNNVMSRKRYQTILRFLYFVHKSQNDPNDPDRDRLHKVRPLVDLLVAKFKATYIQEKNISIDEELLLWKGRLVSSSTTLPNVLNLESRCLAYVEPQDTCGIHMCTRERNRMAKRQTSNW